MDIAEDVKGGRPDDIPAEVWKLAERGMAYAAKRQELIARAILAERERCAKIAENTKTFDWRGGDEWAAGYVDGKNAVATAIRKARS